jgi:hypothetical protein
MFELASSKKIAVVTGGAGFLGSHLSDRLIAEGFRVIAVDNLVTGSPDNIRHLAGDLDFKLLRHNVSEFVFIPGPVDYVFHFASPASPIDYLELPIPTLKVGALGTHNALGLAKEKNAVFVLASTSECYGDPLVHPQNEGYWGNVNPIGPRGVYDEAKRFHSHPIGVSAKTEQKSGLHGSLTLSLDKGDEKKHQTNRIKTHCSATALQTYSAASGSETCARDWCGFNGAILQCMESRSKYALCPTDSRHRSERRL